MRILTTCILLTTFIFTTNAQLDWGSWTSFQLNYKAGKKVTLTAKPIWRQRADLAEYSNTSIDLIVGYKINSKWSASILNRHWFIPEAPDREFYFFDLNYKHPVKGKLSLSHKLRYHLIVNWGLKEPDFVRYNPQLNYKIKSKLTAILAADWFYRVSDVRVLAGGRYKLGFNAILNAKTKLAFEYWRQIKHSDEYPIGRSNFLVLNLSYTLN